MTSDPRLYRRTFGVLAVVVGVGPLAVDSSLPAVRDMADGLGTDMGTVQATLGAFVAGVAVGQLIFGPMSDRYGRRPPLMVGLAAYVVAALALTFTQSIEPVFAIRFIQGTGSAAVFVISRAVVRDLFDVGTSARMFASLFQVLGIFPVVCPIISGELTHLYGWRAVFAFIALVSAVGLAIIWARLGESVTTKDYDALRVRLMGSAVVELLRDPTFRGCLFVGMGAYVGLMTLLAAMPTVIIGRLGGTSEAVGYLYAIVMTIHLASAALGGRLIRRLGIARMIALGVSVIGLAAVASVVVAIADWITPATVVFVNAFLMMGFALANPAMTAGALSNFHHMAGRATAILGFSQQGIGAVTVFLIGLASDGTPGPHAVGMACAGIVAVGSYLAMVRPLRLGTV